MSSIAISLASLVKSNNGFFKSEKQAAFLLSMVNDGEKCFTTAGNVRGNTFTVTYVMDDKGVVSVVKYTNVKGSVTEWQRPVQGETSIQDKKAIAKLKREIKALEKQITARNDSFSKGDYKGMETLYHNANSVDVDTLEAKKQRLAAY